MKTYGEMKVDRYSFLILELNGVKWSALCPVFCPQRHCPRYLKLSHYKPGQSLTFYGVGGSQIWRLSKHEGGKVVSSRHRSPLPPRKYSW